MNIRDLTARDNKYNQQKEVIDKSVNIKQFTVLSK